MFGLILGRSSATIKGLQVFLVIVDSDYIGEIKIMAKAIDNIIIIPQGDRIAQLLLLPLLKTARFLYVAIIGLIPIYLLTGQDAVS